MRYILALLLTLSYPAYATTKWAQGELSDWFRTLHNPNGFLCCGYEDGIQDPPYKENDDGTYEVYYNEGWHHAAKETIVGAISRLAYPIVWRAPTGDVRCFLPGARS